MSDDVTRMKCEGFCDDCLCKHDVDLERSLDLRNRVTLKLLMHEVQRGEIFVADFAECLSVPRKVF